MITDGKKCHYLRVKKYQDYLKEQHLIIMVIFIV